MLGYRIATLLFAAIFIRGCDAKVVVEPVPLNTAVPAQGVIYALPNTVVRLQVKIDKTTRSGARYAPYAAIFAPDGEPVCKDEKCSADEEKNAYSLQQGTTFATYGEPDPEKVFLVKFTGKRTVDQSLSMTWNEAGLLSAASASVTNRTGDVILSGIKLVAGLGAKAALGAAEPRTDTPHCVNNPSPTDEWVIPILRGAGIPSDATLTANYCAIEKTDRDTLPRYDQLLTDAVKDYVDRIAPLVAARNKILTGTSNTFEPASLLSHIEAEINQQLTILYLGTKKTLTWEGAMDVRRLAVGSPLAVLHIDPKNGICVGDADLSPDTKPIPTGGNKFNILTGRACTDAPAINLTLNYFPDPGKQLFTRIADITEGERSFRYRIPAQVKARLDDSYKVYGSGVFAVAQFGTVISLPANRHSKTLSYDLAFIEATGGLKTFKLGTTGGLDASTVDALAGVGGTLIDARNEARKQNDEVNRLTREQQLLKLKDDICTIQKKYGLPCTVQPQ